MQNIGNRLLNQCVAHYVLNYLHKTDFKKTGSPKNTSAWRYLRLSDIPEGTNPSQLGELAKNTALHLRKRVLGNKPNQSMRSIVRDHPELSPMLGHGAQAWLILSYAESLQKIFEIDNGTLLYGLNKGTYRNIAENVIAARLMFANASQRLAQKMYEVYGPIGNQVVFVEGGAGNGAATLTTLKEFHSHGLYPNFWLTDIDPKTLPVAENYFRQFGNFQGHHFPWSQLDIGDTSAVKSLLGSFPGFKTVFNVNFIVHEYETIANKFFKAMSSSPETDLVVSEFFLPEGYPDCDPDPDFPWWFVFLHELSDQYLRTENQFLKIAKKHGYYCTSRLDHQIHNNHPVTSSLFLNK